MRGVLLPWIVAVIIGVALCRPTPISAQDHGHEGATAASHTEAGEAAGQPGIFGWALDLAIWTIVVFLILLWVLSRYAWKPMLEGLQRREDSIRGALDEAQRAREEAKTLQARFEAEMNRAQEKVREVMDEARRDAQGLRDEMVAKAKSEIQTERDRLRHEIEMARDQALAQLWNQTAQLATLISAKAIGRQLKVEDHRELVDEAIAEIRQAGSERQRELPNGRS